MKIQWSALFHRATIIKKQYKNIMSASATQGGHKKGCKTVVCVCLIIFCLNSPSFPELPKIGLGSQKENLWGYYAGRMPLLLLTNSVSPQKPQATRMWANAQHDGRPAEYRWRPLFNAAKFG